LDILGLRLRNCPGCRVSCRAGTPWGPKIQSYPTCRQAGTTRCECVSANAQILLPPLPESRETQTPSGLVQFGERPINLGPDRNQAPAKYHSQMMGKQGAGEGFGRRLARQAVLDVKRQAMHSPSGRRAIRKRAAELVLRAYPRTVSQKGTVPDGFRIGTKF